MKVEIDVCGRCRARQSILDGVCCSCGWNDEHRRMATVAELEAVSERLGIAIVAFEQALPRREGR